MAGNKQKGGPEFHPIHLLVYIPVYAFMFYYVLLPMLGFLDAFFAAFGVGGK